MTDLNRAQNIFRDAAEAACGVDQYSDSSCLIDAYGLVPAGLCFIISAPFVARKIRRRMSRGVHVETTAALPAWIRALQMIVCLALAVWELVVAGASSDVALGFGSMLNGVVTSFAFLLSSWFLFSSLRRSSVIPHTIYWYWMWALILSVARTIVLESDDLNEVASTLTVDLGESFSWLRTALLMLLCLPTFFHMLKRCCTKCSRSQLARPYTSSSSGGAKSEDRGSKTDVS